MSRLHEFFLHASAIISVGPMRVAIDAILVLAILSGMFWMGTLNQKVSTLEYAAMSHEHLAEQMATITVKDQMIIDRLQHIDEHLDRLDHRLK